MQTVKVQKTELLNILTTNLAKHREIFIEAQAGYRARVIEELDALLAKARKGERVPSFWRIQAPINQTPEYERAIRMLEMSVDDTITLTQQEFECYVMDRWHWKKQFLAANKAYSVTAAMSDEGDEDEA